MLGQYQADSIVSEFSDDEPQPMKVATRLNGNAPAAGGVNITFVDKPVSVIIDMGKLSWKMALKLQTLETGKTESLTEITDIISIVIGQDANELPASAVGEILQAITGRMSGASDPNA